MTVIATALKHLIAAGVSGEDLVRAVADMEAAQSHRDPVAERRRAYDRERKRAKKQASTGIPPETAESVEQADPIPPNDIYSNPPVPSEGAKAPSRPLADRVLEAWNEGPGKAGAQPARSMTPDRRKHLATRVRQNSEQAVFDAIANLSRSDWHTGKGENGWRADLDWLLGSPKNFARMLEKGEGAKPAAPAKSPEERAADFEQMAAFAHKRGDRDGEAHFRREAAKARGQPIGRAANDVLAQAQARMAH